MSFLIEFDVQIHLLSGKLQGSPKFLVLVSTDIRLVAFSQMLKAAVPTFDAWVTSLKEQNLGTLFLRRILAVCSRGSTEMKLKNFTESLRGLDLEQHSLKSTPPYATVYLIDINFDDPLECRSGSEEEQGTELQNEYDRGLDCIVQ